MLVPITVPEGFIERHEIRTGAIERTNFTDRAVIFSESTNSTPEDFNVDQLIGAKIKNVDVPINDPERVFTIIGGYYVEPQNDGSAITTRVFGIAGDSTQGFLIVEGGTTVLANHWKLKNVSDGPVVNMDERKRGIKGWTFIVEEVFLERSKYPLSGEPMDMFIEQACVTINRIDKQITRQSAVEIEYEFTAVMNDGDGPASGYTWAFGDGGTGTGQIVTHTYIRGETDAVFNVSVEGDVPDDCNPTSAVTTAEVGEKACPVIDRIDQQVLSQTPLEVTYEFTAVMAEEDESAASYAWTFGDGNTGEGQTVTHSYARGEEDAVFEVEVVGEVPDECDATSAVTTADVGEKTCPEIDRIDQEVVRETAVEIEYAFTAVMKEEDELASQYDWTFGDGGTGQGQSVTHTYAKGEEAAVLDVEVVGTVPSECAATSAASTVDVGEITCPRIERIDANVIGETATEVEYSFTAVMVEGDEEASAYTWTFGDGGTGEGQTTTYVYAKGEDAAVFEVVVDGEVSDDCDATSATTTVDVGERNCPRIDRIDSQLVVETAIAVTYEFTAVMVEEDELASAYTWTFGDGGTGEGQTVTHTYGKEESASSYDVVVTGAVPAECEATTGETSVDIGEQTCPVIASIETEVLRDTAVEIEYRFTAVMVEEDELASAYAWTFGDGTTGEGQSVTHTYAKTDESAEFNVEVVGEVPAECDATSANTTCRSRARKRAQRSFEST